MAIATLSGGVDDSRYRFQTELEQQHVLMSEREAPSALMINPAASESVLAAAATARMQALSNAVGAWMIADHPSLELQEILRPINLLADEVSILLDELMQRLSEQKEAGNG